MSNNVTDRLLHYFKPWCKPIKALYILSLHTRSKSFIRSVELAVLQIYKPEIKTVSHSSEYIPERNFNYICNTIRNKASILMNGTGTDYLFEEVKLPDLVKCPYVEPNHSDKYYSPYGRNYGLIKKREEKAKRFREAVKRRRESDEF